MTLLQEKLYFVKISANRKDRSMSQQRGPTTSLSKRGQIVALANLRGNMRLPLWEIAASTNVPISTCSDIIRLSILRIPQTQILDPCSEENLRPAPTSQKGQNEALTAEEKKNVIALALQDATHCRKSLEELITESGLSISRNTLLNILAADRIHHCRPIKKPFLTANAKAARLEWALKYQNFNFTKVLFTDESHFEASTLRSSRARGVLRWAGEEYLAQNLDTRFPKGSAAMFWGGIMSGYNGSQLPFLFFPSPVETQAQWNASIVRLQQEFQMDTNDYNYFTASARKKCALGEAAVRPDAANPPGTPRAPGASGYWLPRTVDAWCVQIMVAWQPAAHCLLKGAFLCE